MCVIYIADRHGKKNQVYTWGSAAGEIAGDKFEGRFKRGAAHGYGRTSFNNGGWHKVISSLMAPILHESEMQRLGDDAKQQNAAKSSGKKSGSECIESRGSTKRGK